MGFDDLCNTGLVLGLGLSSSTNESKSLISSQKLDHHKITFEPLLTLSLSRETHINNQARIKEVDLYRQDSGGGSSFSNVSVKREREIVSEGVEKERISFSRASVVEDEDGSNGRKKLRLTKSQSALLEESFKQHSSLNPKQKQELAKDLKLRPRQVEVWFQNRRARTKLKQTEVDCEFLKKCCETLTDENRGLQKELKALKSAQSLYMQLPAATLTMCPSCERIEKTTKTSFAMAPKPHFYNPFTNSSAAC